MEEIYIIKLKGLPANTEEALKYDHKSNFYYRKDLTAEALLGFGLFQALIGLTLIILAVINLVNDGVARQIGVGIWCGGVFVMTGLSGAMTAQKRKRDISKSKIQLKIFFGLSIISTCLTSSYLILVSLGIHESAANVYLSANILTTFIAEFFISLLSIFVSIRVIWPGSFPCLAKDWPGHPKFKRKVIVSTQIYTDGSQQDADVIRSLGPNCIVSLSAPPPIQTNVEEISICNEIAQEVPGYSGSGQSGSTCPCCDVDAMNCNQNQFGASRTDESPNQNCFNNHECQQDYDSASDEDDVDVAEECSESDFDAEHFDSIVEAAEGQEEIDRNEVIETETDESNQEENSSYQNSLEHENFQKNDFDKATVESQYVTIEGNNYQNQLQNVNSHYYYNYYHPINNNLNNNRCNSRGSQEKFDQVYETIA